MHHHSDPRHLRGIGLKVHQHFDRRLRERCRSKTEGLDRWSLGAQEAVPAV